MPINQLTIDCRHIRLTADRCRTVRSQRTLKFNVCDCRASSNYEKIERKILIKCKTNLREGYLYVRINIGEDQHVVYGMHVYDNQPKMNRFVPKYRKELFRNENPNVNKNKTYNYNKRWLIEEVVEVSICY
jgi:hypothetical protein